MIAWPPSWPSWRAVAAGSLALTLSGFAGGLWTGLTWAGRKERKPQVLTVGAGKAQPGQDLSPHAAPRTVQVAATRPGVPPAPPVPVPRDLGEQVRTSTVDLPANPQPVTVDFATFARIESGRLLLRDVAWTTGPGSPVPLRVETIEREAPLPLPPAPKVPRWEAAVILAPFQGRVGYGAELSRAFGPFTVGGMILPQAGPDRSGYAGYIKAGLRW